jgi:hypothetical protein
LPAGIYTSEEILNVSGTTLSYREERIVEMPISVGMGLSKRKKKRDAAQVCGGCLSSFPRNKTPDSKRHPASNASERKFSSPC